MRQTNSWCLACLALFVGAATPIAGQILTKPPITAPTIYTAPVTSGRYRVVISGFASSHETVDNDKDGKKDEVYAAAAFVLWNRRDGRMISTPNVIRTVEYGDIGGRLGSRIEAGTASAKGGIWGGNNGDYVPTGLNPQASVGSGTSDKLPLLVFEGGLSDSTEALLVAPSLWESDSDPSGFTSYSNNWKSGGIGTLINSPAVQNQLTMAGLSSIVAPGDPTIQVANFLGGPIGAYLLNALYGGTNDRDRPIGLIDYQGSSKYQDRLVVITREKLASLAVGAGMTLPIPFAEPMNNRLNGLYTAFIRVERIQ